jgi:hypothetical protein
MSTDTTTESSAHADLIQRYAAWETKLGENIDSLSRQRTVFYWIFFGALITSTLGFFFGSWFGVGSFLTGLAFCGTGLYLTIMRRRQYDDELLHTRAELRRLMERRDPAVTPCRETPPEGAEDAIRAKTAERCSLSTTRSLPAAAARP